MKKKTAWLLVLCMIVSLFSIMIPYGTINAQAEETAESSTFVHPGILHTQKSIDAVKANIAAGDATTVAAYNALLGDGYSNPGWKGRPLEHVVRGNSGDNRAQMYIDIERAYHTGLLYNLGAGDQYGDATVTILNGWAHTMKSLSGNADRFLAAGIYGYQMANAAELVRDHKDFDKEAMDTLLLNIFYPMNKDFLENHNGAAISNYWANWDLCNIASMMAIGIFCDREDIYHEALSYYKNGEGMGSLFNTMPYVYAEGDYGEEFAQWQEAGRDQGHATLGIGLCGAINEMAWSQGDDLYGMSDNRFLKAAEYVARYNNTADTENCDNLPFSSYTRKNSANGHYETGTGISGAGRPSGRPIYTAIYNHYVNRMGLEAPALKKILYPEDGSLVIEGGSRNGDQPGWQSLMFNNISTTEEGKNLKETVGSLEDGIYRFCNNLSKKTLIDNNGKLQCAKKGSTDTEWWNVKNTGNGEYVISNVKTGRVIQINSDTYDSDSPAYAAGTVFTLGDSVTGEMNQRLAILKNKNDYVYRIANAIGSHVMELANANTADDATICQWRYEGGTHQQWLPEEKETKGVIAYFNFDDKTEGFKGAGAAATVNGTVDIVEDAVAGKALKLDGTGTNYLTVTKENGDSLLMGLEELTISYWNKVDNDASNWVYYMAPDDAGQNYLTETYLGMLEKQGGLTAERYKNSGQRPGNATATVTGGAWNHVTVVYSADKTSIYVNGVLSSEMGSGYKLSDILGENGIFYLGKANWGTGEYYNGLIDEVSIYDYALDAKEVEKIYQAPEAVKNVTELVNAIGTVDASAGCKAKIDAARAAYDGLFEIQKEMLTEAVSTALTTAEAAYKKAVEEAGESGGGSTETGGNESGGGNTETGGNESGGGNTETGGNENSGGNNQTSGGSTDNGSGNTDTGSGTTNTGNGTTSGATSDTEQAQKEQAQAGTTAVEETQKTITSANTDNGDVAGSKFAALKVKAKEGNKSVKLSWSRVNGADGYIIYGAPCGKKMEQIKELTASKKTYTVRKLLKGKYYKYMVVAYKNIYGEKRVIETSVSVHIATKGGKYGNPTAVTYGKSKVSVKTGKTFTLKPGLKTKTKVKTHIAKFRYESTDPSVATVNKKGVIKAKKKGTCTIYVYAQNGVYAKVTVKVKK